MLRITAVGSKDLFGFEKKKKKRSYLSWQKHCFSTRKTTLEWRVIPMKQGETVHWDHFEASEFWLLANPHFWHLYVFFLSSSENKENIKPCLPPALPPSLWHFSPVTFSLANQFLRLHHLRVEFGDQSSFLETAYINQVFVKEAYNSWCVNTPGGRMKFLKFSVVKVRPKWSPKRKLCNL